jgi:glycine cleavage system H lipoate-binding protein/ABC-type phosphate transport system substrate-binding protein
MKTSIFVTGILLLLFCGSANSTEAAGKSAALQQGKVTILTTPDLYQLTSIWAGEYTSRNPGIKIEVSKVASNSIELGAAGSLSFISTKSQAAIANAKNWKMVVGRNIIVPVMNTGNLYLKEILHQGVSPAQFAMLIENPDKQNWGTLFAAGQNKPVHIYIVDNETIKSGVVKFLQLTQLPVNGITIGTKDEVIPAIQKDPDAIGFCNVVDILDAGNQSLVENIRLLPIDKNGNGTMDHIEDIYGDLNIFQRGIWLGKYPKTLYNNIYATGSEQPVEAEEQAFLAWVLSDGQQYMNANGFADLAGSESRAQLDKLNTEVINVEPTKETSQAGLILLIIVGFITAGVIVGAVIRRYKKQESVIPDFNISSPGFDEDSVVLPQGLYFDKSHTWAFMEKNGNVTIGIDDFLQHITGPITRIEMKNPGERIKKGDLLFSIIQSGKQLDLYAPVSGIIKKQNIVLSENSSFMNTSPYSEGWVYIIEPNNWIREIQFLDMAASYRKWISNEFSRVKDFLAATLKPESLEYSHVVLQDGGVLKDGVLADFGPEVWDDFQTNFLDTYK